MECYNCGAALGKGATCPECGADVRVYKKIIAASNALYNDGLEKARVRDLSGAIDSLRASLHYNKRNENARNLLGLVYFEVGEVVKALTEWVISRSYSPSKDNAANRYIDDVQNNRSRLDSINSTIKKYNQALAYCGQGSDDLAILQLRKVLSLNPNFVKAHQLLALLYIKERDYEAAKQCLRNAGRIDADNTITLRYLKEANAGIKQGAPKRKKKSEELVSYQSGNETIIQPRYHKEHFAASTILNMVIGIAIGVAITVFLFVPEVRQDARNEAKAEILDANSQIAAKNQAISDLEAQIDEMEGEVDAAQKSEKDSASRMESYEELLNAYAAFQAKDADAASSALAKVSQDDLSDAGKKVYEAVSGQVDAETLRVRYDEATAAYSAQDYEKAIEAYEYVVEREEDYDAGNAIFYLAQSYRKSDDAESAAKYYRRVLELHPGTQRAAIAQEFLGGMQPQAAAPQPQQ